MRLWISLIFSVMTLALITSSAEARFNFNDKIAELNRELNNPLNTKKTLSHQNLIDFSDALTGKGCGLSSVVFTPITFAPVISLTRQFAKQVQGPLELKSKLLSKHSDPFVAHSPENSFLWFFMVRALQTHSFVMEAGLQSDEGVRAGFSREILGEAKAAKLHHVNEAYLLKNIQHFSYLSGGKFFSPKKQKEPEPSKDPVLLREEEESDDDYAIRLSLATPQPRGVHSDGGFAETLRRSKLEADEREETEKARQQRIGQQALERGKERQRQEKIIADRLFQKQQDREYAEALAIDKASAVAAKKKEEEEAAEEERFLIAAEQDAEKERLRIKAEEEEKEAREADKKRGRAALLAKVTSAAKKAPAGAALAK